MRSPFGRSNGDVGKDWVAIILAIGLSVGVNCLTIGVLYDAIVSSQSGLSENATQILVASFGGMIGVLGSYIGYKAGTFDRKTDSPTRDDSSIDHPAQPVISSHQEAPDPSNQHPFPIEDAP